MVPGRSCILFANKSSTTDVPWIGGRALLLHVRLCCEWWGAGDGEVNAHDAMGGVDSNVKGSHCGVYGKELGGLKFHIVLVFHEASEGVDCAEGNEVGVLNVVVHVIAVGLAGSLDVGMGHGEVQCWSRSQGCWEGHVGGCAACLFLTIGGMMWWGLGVLGCEEGWWCNPLTRVGGCWLGGDSMGYHFQGRGGWWERKEEMF
eukprot:8237394-Ditylum_brightwellii.AAC.1